MAVSIPPFFRTRNGIIAVIVIAIVLILALVALTWSYTPDIYSGIGLRHDASLEKYVGALHSVAVEQHPTNLTLWSVSWYNSTAVKVTWAYTYLAQPNATSNQTKLLTYQESFVMTNFFGTKSASAYVGSVNSNNSYKLMTTTYGGSGAYERAFGHPPSTFAEYKQEQEAVGNFIWQFDQFVQVGSLTRTYAA